MRARLVALIGWFVSWDDSVPLHDIWTDLDSRHETYWLWRWRLAGWFVCPIKGHDWYPDHCMRPEHDRCYRCGCERS